METQPVVAAFHANDGILQIEYEADAERRQLFLKLTDFQQWELLEALLQRRRFRASE